MTDANEMNRNESGAIVHKNADDYNKYLNDRRNIIDRRSTVQYLERIDGKIDILLNMLKEIREGIQ